MSAPELSVVVPGHNCSKTVQRALLSVLNASFENLEIIFVDDGSDDETVGIVSTIEDPRFRIIQQAHSGVAVAANHGVAEARAPIIARMDADDHSYPERFSQQLEWIKSHSLDAVGGLVRIIDDAGNPVSSMRRYERWVNEWRDPDSIAAYRFVESPLVNPTMMAKREVFESGYREGPFPEDYDLLLRALQAGYRFGKVPEIVLDWTDGPDRLTRTSNRYSMAAFDRCRREHLLSGPLKNARVCNLWGAGKTGKPWLRWLKENQRTVEFVIEVDERKIGRAIHGVPILSHANLPRPDGNPLLIAVGAKGAGELIAPVLNERGYIIGKDAWFVA